jgi:hypothetical protein
MSESISSENSSSIFTLANLPIRMVIYLSVIGSMILPSYVNNHGILYDLNRNYKTVTVQPKNNIGAIIRAQQAYHFENNEFADLIAELGLGIKAESSTDSYRIVQSMMPVQDLNQSAISERQESMIMAIGQRKIEENKDQQAGIIPYNYFGVVYTLPQTSASGGTEIATHAALCEMNEKNPLPTTMPKLINGEIQCPKGAKNLLD